MPLSKPFVIATEGPTVDGRNISRQWIADMAKSYDPKVYTAVANLEHFLSSLPDGIFKAYGKVMSLSTQEAELMGEKKLQLLAVVDASEDIIALQKKGQKAFASIEVLNNFIGKGLTYLGGMAFTDTPASIGTESMQFSFGGAPGERYACQSEVAIEFEEENKPNLGEQLFAKVKALLVGEKKDTDARFTDQAQAVEAVAQSQSDMLKVFGDMNKVVKQLEQQVASLGTSVKENADAFSALEARLGSESGTPARPPAAGGDGTIKTDC